MGKPDLPPDPPGKKLIARHDFEAVIRRAADLASREGEAEELLSEEEVVRIAAEIGLSQRHVQQALFELPELESQPSALTSYYGPSVITASRIIPGDAELTIRRIEEYLTTSEYLQLVRRKQGRLIFQPAEDTISLLARGLLRPSSRFQLARARKVVLSARSIDAGTAHVQIATDLEDQRRSSMRTGIGVGAAGGLIAGVTGMAVIALTLDPSAITGIAHVVSLVGGTAAGVWTGIKATGSSFRKRIAAARLELDGLLDRAERGDKLEPPPAPWRRRLELRLGRGGGG